MKNVTTHIGTLEIVKRLPTSRLGNPRFLVRVDGTSCRTAVDSSYGYEVENYSGQRVIAQIGTHYGHATLRSLSRFKDYEW